MDLDLALRVDEPPTLTYESMQDERDHYEEWERSNRLSLLLIQSHIVQSIRTSLPKNTNAKEFLETVQEQFVTSDKALVATLMGKLVSLKHTADKGVREHIMEMDVATQLQALKVEIFESFLVFFIINSLSVEYSQFKISYNIHKGKWSLNKLLTMCVQDEGRLRQEKLETTNLVVRGKNKEKKAGVFL
ncbi:uncharacterized protein LOC143861499 [Tasmannia lanceolata]|uniref:uncharacterized protein LOC143861499 n=1 Tax=Tasmannia lanceolata TaxID=3420 RepID=UPI0040639EF6